MASFKDSCGVGFIANVNGEKSHDVLKKALKAVANLTHRGATLADGRTGDGSGVLFQIPQPFFQKEAKKLSPSFPEGPVAVGVVFLKDRVDESFKLIERECENFGIRNVVFRKVPINEKECGQIARKAMPEIYQFMIPSIDDVKLYILRRKLEKKLSEISRKNYVVSLSNRTIVYKGMLLAPDLPLFYSDLSNEEFKTAIALFHQRYSTNTNPEWRLAQPLRMLAHNGEINTITANRNYMQAVEPVLDSEIFGKFIDDIKPLVDFDESDSASLDRVFELMVLAGYSPEEAMSILIPPAYEMLNLEDEEKAFFTYQLLRMKPWDGPAAVAFTDGVVAGAKLDRNGLRPARYTVLEDGTVIFGSEVGIVETPFKEVKKEGRLQPGEIFVVDTAKKEIRYNEEILKFIAMEFDYQKEVRRKLFKIADFKTPIYLAAPAEEKLVKDLVRFGYSVEELEKLVEYMAEFGKEPVYSMGDDTPIPNLSNQPKLLFRYFKQRFAQVTNPPIDPIREKVVMSLKVRLGAKINFLEKFSPLSRRVELDSPVLTPSEFEALKNVKFMKIKEFKLSFEDSLEKGLEELFESVKRAIEHENIDIVILSDREVEKPIPSLLAVAGLMNFLKEKKLLHKVSFVVESGEIRDTHQIATLIGYGAGAVYPYLVYEYLRSKEIELNKPFDKLVENYREAANKGLLKIFSKMGISLFTSYHLGQNFDIIGLSSEVVDRYFKNTFSPIGGATLKDIENDVLQRVKMAKELDKVPNLGELMYRPGGEKHGFSTPVVRAILKACRSGNFEEFLKMYDYYRDNPVYIRDALKIVSDREPIPLDEVEPAEEIIKRLFVPGMSVGALSKHAHETIAEGVNKIGAKSCSGEGGEHPERYGTIKNSKIKQVASGRFGVTPAYLASASEIEIKIAQGAKPGEGGHLPGKKVTPYIAELRHTVPGVALISPPPHHDIYSIEDLAQLIYDLKVANPNARVSVKLVSESGVGTVACGVAKAKADAVLISGGDGGTGASPMISIKNAGLPWEIGVPQTHRDLFENGLREKVILRVDGGLKNGRDVVVAALLGAEEFGFGTAAMIAEGCVYDRECHSNKCPVGIATQDEKLCHRFKATPEMVSNFFRFVAEDVRRLLAQMGYKSLSELIGRADLLKPNEDVIKRFPKAKNFDFSYITNIPKFERKVKEPFEKVTSALNEKIVKDVVPFIESGKSVEREYEIKNTDRTIGTPLAFFISRKYGPKGAPPNLVRLTFKGVAGQSFGAFLPSGVSMTLIGKANDYVAKGLGGGIVVLRFPDDFKGHPHENVIAGNTILYGATAGAFFAAGRVGERFAVRNSGAVAVVEGAGQHACEYMVRGVAVILGQVGMNFGAGMTGGIAYVFDEQIDEKINKDYVVTAELTKKDTDLLKDLLGKHYKYTKSERAAQILTTPYLFSKFKKVYPIGAKEIEFVTLGVPGIPD